jgi:hypothetical protein
LLKSVLVRARIHQRQEIAFVHHLAFAECHLHQLAVDLGAHRDRCQGRDGAQGAQADADVATGRPRGAHRLGPRLLPLSRTAPTAARLLALGRAAAQVDAYHHRQQSERQPGGRMPVVGLWAVIGEMHGSSDDSWASFREDKTPVR